MSKPTMTLEQVRDWHLRRTNYMHLSITNRVHKEMADVIDAHLAERDAQPAAEQAVDVGAIRAVALQLKTRRLFGNSATWDDCDFFSNKLTRAISPTPNKEGA